MMATVHANWCVHMCIEPDNIHHTHKATYTNVVLQAVQVQAGPELSLTQCTADNGDVHADAY